MKGVSESRRRLHTLAISSVVGSVAGWHGLTSATTVQTDTIDQADKMGSAAQALLTKLDGDRQKKLVLSLDSPWRRNWHYTPRARPGITLAELSEDERGQVWSLLAHLLSKQGLQKARDAIRLEQVLGELTNNLGFRDPENYALVLFGRPDGQQHWAWRFEGHHLSLSVTVSRAKGIAVTPAFFGANPQTVPGGHALAGLRMMPAEADLAFSLINGLPSTQRSAAIIATDSPRNIIAGPGREASLRIQEGVPLGALDGPLKTQAIKLIEAYIGNMSESVAARERQRLEQSGLRQVQFAWAGSLTPGRPHYYRLHGPTLLIEYDNSQNGANHVHSVWHDPVNGFGDDVLKAHYDHAPHGHGHQHA
ncbi:MAG: DUF3500 domain-containing protein [Burkholderiaceae bacterium]